MTEQRKPAGMPADIRIIGAVQNLRDQFGICGLKAPIGIIVAPGQVEAIEAMIAGSGILLFSDTAPRGSETAIWGIKLMEEKP